MRKGLTIIVGFVALIYAFVFMFSACGFTNGAYAYAEYHHDEDCQHIYAESNCYEEDCYFVDCEPLYISLSVTSFSEDLPTEPEEPIEPEEPSEPELPPQAEIIKSDTDNSIKVVWTNENWTGTLNGASYVNGTWITAEGSYLFVIKNSQGASKTYNFSIMHLYESETVAPTCSEKGYTRYTCKQCGSYYDSNSVSAKGHIYIQTTISTTCNESGGILNTCTVCDYNYLSDVDYPSGHNYDSTVIRDSTCTQTGQLREVCEYCHEQVTTTVPALGHNYQIIEVYKSGKETIRKLECTNCGGTYTENLGNQYERVGSYMELIFNTYRPYMVLALIATAGVWSIFIGINYIIAKKNEEKEKARRMLVNYAIGLLAIFAILVACPYLIRGITALVT